MNQEADKYNWYALRTIPHKEKYVSKELEIRSFESYLPYYRFYLDKNKYKEKLLISSYVFVKAMLKDFEKLHYIPGSKGLLYCDEKPGLITNDEIEILRQICGNSEYEPEICMSPLGQKVKILNGFLKGRIAYVCECKKNKIGIEFCDSNFIIWISPKDFVYEVLK